MEPKSGKRGITILEIIATTAIVIVVGLALFPIQTGGRDSALSTACISNLKQTALGAQMYAADCDERLPLAKTWSTSTFPYSQKTDVYRCPILRTPRKDVYGHAYHRSVSGRKTGSFKHPEAEVLLFDSKDLSFSAYGGLDLLPVTGRQKKGAHGIAFVDGHAARRTRAALITQYLGVARP